MGFGMNYKWSPGGHVFQQTGTIFKPHPRYHQNKSQHWCKKKNAPAPGGHVFQPKGTIFALFYEDRTINVASIVLMSKNAPPPGAIDHKFSLKPYEEKCTAGYVFQPTGAIFELINVASDINKENAPGGTNLLTKFLASRVKNAPPNGGNVFLPTRTIFKLFQDIIGKSLLTKFHEDRTINVTSRKLTRQMLTQHYAQRTKGNNISSP
ncbi:hypothetical protein DPMN_034606 [Dreissena polymorpha]|uniref:Uncharacterized protein n=1 Tax=Dreissena polymorpha TaxID=45954 RepID=A0A9D4MAG1_DREPO|nr:hypothetical protein DPMN_034606 [Dreissena polymorpha]